MWYNLPVGSLYDVVIILLPPLLGRGKQRGKYTCQRTLESFLYSGLHILQWASSTWCSPGGTAKNMLKSPSSADNLVFASNKKTACWYFGMLFCIFYSSSDFVSSFDLTGFSSLVSSSFSSFLVSAVGSV